MIMRMISLDFPTFLYNFLFDVNRLVDDDRLVNDMHMVFLVVAIAMMSVLR